MRKLFGLPLVLLIFYVILYMTVGTRDSSKIPEPTKAPAPTFDVPGVKSTTVSFNHLQAFCIHNERIWVRPLEGEGEWSEVPFVGTRMGLLPQALYVGGANLLVVDQLGRAYYKKVLEERRIPEEDYRYVAEDLASAWNWEPVWFSLPYVSPVYNLFAGGPLQIPENVQALAMSHLGQYAYECQDGLGRPHWVDVGTTTLFALERGGRTIRALDPWVPPYVAVRISLPSDSESSFHAVGFDADGSTILCIGYRVHSSGQRELALYSIEWDIDNAGWHPTRPYGYFADQADADTRLLPPHGWKEEPLPPARVLSSAVTVVQTGRGSLQRQLRVEGIDQDGRRGYYHKAWTDTSWDFEPEPGRLTGMVLNTDLIDLAYQSGRRSWSADLGAGLRATLQNFDPQVQQATMKLYLGGDEFAELLVYRRLSLVRESLMLNGVSFDLVLRSPEQQPLLEKLFGGRECRVTIRQNGRKLEIKPTWGAWWSGAQSFSWTLT